MHDRWPYPLIDHISGNSLDDRPENIREADYLLNARNHLYRSIRITHNNRYQARIGQHSIGVFSTRAEAEKAYDEERAKLWET